MNCLVRQFAGVIFIILILSPNLLAIHYSENTNHWYGEIQIAGEITWQECRDSAEALGGYLATVTTLAENNLLVGMISPRDAYLGGTDVEEEGTWKWITGEEWGLVNWRDGEPNNDGYQHYLILSSSDGKWDDYWDTHPGPISFIVEWEKNPTLTTFGNHWYKRIQIPTGFTWHQCRDSAEAMGGYLVTVNSGDENSFLWSLALPYHTFLGGTDEESEGTWKWVTGETFGFTAWISGEPNNYGDEDYLAMHAATGLWNDQDNYFLSSQVFIVEWNSNPNRKQFGEHWYERITIPAEFTWQQCRDSARALGGHLATIGTAEENDFLAALSEPHNSFLGATDEGSEGTWKWITNEEWNFETWAPGEPDGTPLENYLALDCMIGKWYDMTNQFATSQAFIVEWENNPERVYFNGHWY